MGRPNAIAAPILIFSIILPTHPHIYLLLAAMIYLSLLICSDLHQLSNASYSNFKSLDLLISECIICLRLFSICQGLDV